MAAQAAEPPEEKYLSCENATSLWALVYSQTRFNRRVVTAEERKALGLGARQLAFRQGAFVPAAARHAGVQINEVILGVDGVRKTGSYFDPRAYLLPLPGTFGNVGRNTLLGPGLADLDASVEKGFRVRENLNVRFRAEFYNALNHTNFGLPIASVFTPSGFFNPAAGLIVNTVTTSRQIQFGLSVNF